NPDKLLRRGFLRIWTRNRFFLLPSLILRVIDTWIGFFASCIEAGNMGSLVLLQVVLSRKFFPTVVALKRFLISMDGEIVTVKMLFAWEATGAETTNVSPGGVFSERLFAAATAA